MYTCQGSGDISWDIYWDSALQDNRHLHRVPDSLLAHVLRHYMDPHSWCPLPTLNHVARPSEAIHSLQVLQMGSPSGPWCCRIRGSPCSKLQHVIPSEFGQTVYWTSTLHIFVYDPWIFPSIFHAEGCIRAGARYWGKNGKYWWPWNSRWDHHQKPWWDPEDSQPESDEFNPNTVWRH